MYATHASEGTVRTVCCSVMAVMMPTTPSASSLPLVTYPRVTGDAPSVLQRYGAPNYKS